MDETRIEDSHDSEDVVLPMIARKRSEKKAVNIENDPLEQLLREFEDITDEYADEVELNLEEFGIGLDLDENLFSYEEDDEESCSLETSSNLEFTQIEESDSVSLRLSRKVIELKELRKRMKYYLDEVELFLPKKRTR